MNDFERRIERLEQAAQLSARPALIVFDERDHDDPKAAADAYIATTPESEQAELVVVVNCVFPSDELHGVVS